MSEFSEQNRPSASPFSGLVPSRVVVGRSDTGHIGAPRDQTARMGSREALRGDSNRGNRALMATMPVLLASTLTLSTLGIAPLVHSVKPEHRPRANSTGREPRAATIDAESFNADSLQSSSSNSGEVAVAAVAPATYVVRAGDTVSGIAGRFGLSTASVLALNGLSWKSLIFPGQTLTLTKAPSATAAVATVVTPTPPATSAASSSVASSSASSYVIQRGDTVTSIARRFGVTIAAILTANDLASSSIIYSGRKLVIPGTAFGPAVAPAVAASVSGVTPTLVGSVTVPLSASMRSNAQVIITVGRQLNVPDYGIIVALATAAQESNLENLTYGDRDSVGLFQQRPSAGWGSVAQLTTPSYAAALFYGGPSNPNRGKTRGLLDIPGWQSLSVTQAAQAVQISGAPNAYAKWEASARVWFAQLS